MSNAPQMAEVAALVGDPARANILCALPWRRSFTRARQAPSLLPPVCGLDRTTTAYRGCSWCGLGEPVLRTEMDRTGARQSRPHHYASRPPRADGSLRAFNLTAARLTPRAGVSFKQTVAEADVLPAVAVAKGPCTGRAFDCEYTAAVGLASARPPPPFPFGTDKNVRTIYFIYGTVTRVLVDDSLRAAADLQREGLSFDARSGVHPRAL